MNAANTTNATNMAPAELNAADLAAWIRRSNELVAEHADELTRLDSAIGDADHGVNMKRGLTSAVEVLDPVPDSPEVVLKKVAMTLIARVGGASGPLYGTFFLRMAAVSAGRRGLARFYRRRYARCARLRRHLTHDEALTECEQG